MDNMMLWNILLTLLATGFGWAFNKMFQEIKRLQILLNKTREDYASKEDLRYTSNRIVETLNRLEDKLDRHMENNRG